MNANRRFLSRATLVLCTAAFVAFLGLGVGCSSDTIDSIKGDATAQGVETGLNSALLSTVEPLVVFLGEVPSIVNPPAARSSLAGVSCPGTSGVCSGGSVSCASTGGGTTLTFVFDHCGVATGDLPLTLTGSIVVTPGTSISLTLVNLVINGSSAMNGTGEVNVLACSYEVNVGTADSIVVDGTIVQCDPGDTYPKAVSTLSVSFDDVEIVFSFDGSDVAHATASKSSDVVAYCDINLAENPFSSSCSAP